MSTKRIYDTNRHRYCCNPFHNHGVKQTKDLRSVTEKQAESHPSKVLLGQKICSKCRKTLAKLPSENQSSSCRSSQVDDEECIDVRVDPPEMDADDNFVSPEADLGAINHSLELIGVSPFKKRNMKRSATYVPRKKERVKETFLTKIDALAAHSSTP